jgi:hypothetical protein
MTSICHRLDTSKEFLSYICISCLADGNLNLTSWSFFAFTSFVGLSVFPKTMQLAEPQKLRELFEEYTTS